MFTGLTNKNDKSNNSPIRYREQDGVSLNKPKDIGKNPIIPPLPLYDLNEGYKDNDPKGQTKPTSRLPTKESYQKNPYATSSTKSEKRTGMSQTAWSWVLSITEVASDVIKGGLVVGGIIAANLADFIMGSIAVSLLVSPRISEIASITGFWFGAIISMGSSAIQIYMWSLIQKRGIKFSTLLKPKYWKHLDGDVKGFLLGASLLWFMDTLLDVSPMFVIFTSDNFLSFPTLYGVLVASVAIVLIILCGFAEILTSNMRGMFNGQ